MFAREIIIFSAFFVGLTPALETALGDISHSNDFPYLVRIEKYGKHRCDASIVGINFVLTSVHCVLDSSIYEHDSLLSYRILVPDQTHTRELSYGIKNIYIHHNYSQRRLGNTANIALLRSETNFRLINNLEKIKIINRSPEEKELALVVGHGKDKSAKYLLKLQQNTETDKTLYSAMMNVFLVRRCEEILGGEIGSDQICAGDLLKKGDPCISIGGGPLVIKGKLAGIANWNMACGEKNNPGVYTNAFYYREWIYSTIKKFE